MASKKTGRSSLLTLLRPDSVEIDIKPLVLVHNYRTLLETDPAITAGQLTRQRLQKLLRRQHLDTSMAGRETFPLMLQGDNLVLHIQPVAFNPRNYTPDSVMSELRRRLAHAGRQANPLLKLLVKNSGQRSEWNAWLPRHEVQLRALLAHEPPQRKIREQFYYDIQQQLLLYSDRADSIARLANRPSLVTPNEKVSTATASITKATQNDSPAPATSKPSSATAKEALSVLYDREFVLASVPTRRVMHITVSDRGSSAQGQGQARYLLCMRYSTRTSSKFQGLTVPEGCLSLDGYVTASADLVQMERELFVEKIIHALDTINLKPLSANPGKDVSLVKISEAYSAAKDTAVIKDKQLLDMKQLDGAANDAQAKAKAAKARLFNAQTVLSAQKLPITKSDSLHWNALQKEVSDASSDTTKANALSKEAEKQRPTNKALTKANKDKYIADTTFAGVRTRLVKTQSKSVKQAVKNGDILLLDEVALSTSTLEKEQSAPITTARDKKKPVATPNARSEAPATISALNSTRISTSLDATVLRERLLDIYLDYVRQQTLYLAAPKAGTMLVHDQVKMYNIPQDRHFPAIAQGTFRLDSVQMKVEDGSITDLKAVGSNDRGQAMLFESHTPIGISSDADMHNRNSWYKRHLWSQARSKPLPRENRLYIELNDLLVYFPSVENEDRSPAEGVYTFRPNDPLIRRTLTKEPTAKILQARIYTDLAGVKSDRPNGLVQVEIAKKIVFGSPWSRNSPGIQFRVLGYVTPLLALNKVEEQNRYLPLNLVGATTTTPFFRVNTIDLVRYTNLRVGLDLNLASMRLPQYKSDYSVDLSLYLNRVDVRDSVRTQPSAIPRVDSTLNVASYGLNVKWRIRPDSRYGIQARLGYMRYALINTSGTNGQLAIEQTPDVNQIHPGAHTLFGRYFFQGVMQYELTGWLNVSKNAMFFVRPQFSHLLFQSNRTYFQMQVGYQFDVFTRRRDVPVGPPSLLPAAP